MITEQTVERGFRKLFQDRDFGTDAVQQAQELLDQLRLESPLRHRLETELDELRNLLAAKTSAKVRA